MTELLEKLVADYQKMKGSYKDSMQPHEFGYTIIRLAAKQLLDEAPRHMVALETIRLATEAGIKQHVEEKEESHG